MSPKVIKHQAPAERAVVSSIRALRDNSISLARAMRAMDFPENASHYIALARERNQLLVRLLTDAPLGTGPLEPVTGCSLLQRQAE